jgi:hypothetical protein
MVLLAWLLDAAAVIVFVVSDGIDGAWLSLAFAGVGAALAHAAATSIASQPFSVDLFRPHAQAVQARRSCLGTVALVALWVALAWAGLL